MLATYKNVISSLGSVGPFANVAESEQQHVTALATLFSHYGTSLPAASSGQVSPSTRTAACSLGVSLEQHAVSMYGTLLPKVSAYPEVTKVFQNIRTTSEENHLPAFEHCA